MCYLVIFVCYLFVCYSCGCELFVVCVCLFVVCLCVVCLLFVCYLFCLFGLGHLRFIAYTNMFEFATGMVEDGSTPNGKHSFAM